MKTDKRLMTDISLPGFRLPAWNKRLGPGMKAEWADAT
jgi:hypothetical protein